MIRERQYLLWAGVIAGPLFYLVVLVQIPLKTGFSIWEHPVSLLALGPGGWVQAVNFAITGLLFLLAGLGMFGIERRRLHAALIVLSGIGLVVVAINPSDPFKGFPPEVASVPELTMSRHAMLHGLGFLLCFGSLLLTALWTAIQGSVLKDIASAAPAAFTCVTVIALIWIGFANPDLNSESFFLAGIIAFGWFSVLCRTTSMRGRTA
ncbi:DUF998 domain-containing protein [Nitratireductor soli]|uniref:DUF998 domain-containing protein n=1 Tax=Nitratireductor soli TaxID=1670619 RepID=UPI00065E3F37|nr:DUF998 domain-containing protein [Nitratireductor soli]